jgi:hypothetical protein
VNSFILFTIQDTTPFTRMKINPAGSVQSAIAKVQPVEFRLSDMLKARFDWVETYSAGVKCGAYLTGT